MNNKNIKNGTWAVITNVVKITGETVPDNKGGLLNVCEGKDGKIGVSTKVLVDTAFSFEDGRESEVKMDNRTELIKEFEKQLPYVIGKVVEINLNEKPEFNELYEQWFEKGDKPKNKTQFKKSCEEGNERTLKGFFYLGANGELATRHGYLLFKDVEDNFTEKMINVRKLNYFIFNKKYTV